MPIYTCDCCKYSTPIKTQYERHNLTSKHITNFEKSNSNEDQIPTTKDNTESIDMLFDEIDALKKDNAAMKADNMAMKADNMAMKASLEECKQLIMLMKNNVPTPTPPPQQIVIQTLKNEPEIEKPKQEPCNPRYFEKEMNEAPEDKNTPDIETYFSIKQDHVKFDFSKVNSLTDVADIGKQFVIEHVVDFVKQEMQEEKRMPFIYHKSSWYIKTKKGWEKNEVLSNKGKCANHQAYIHDIIVKSFIFIMQNRCISHFNELNGSTAWLMKEDAPRLLAEVFSREGFTNKEILNPLSELFC